MEHLLQSSTETVHFLDHVKGILYLATGKTLNVESSQLPHEVYDSLDCIKKRFIQSGIMGVDDIITAAL
jgi:hypothetical protein